jgi:hypothetical protein
MGRKTGTENCGGLIRPIDHAAEQLLQMREHPAGRSAIKPAEIVLNVEQEAKVSGHDAQGEWI